MCIIPRIVQSPAVNYDDNSDAAMEVQTRLRSITKLELRHNIHNSRALCESCHPSQFVWIPVSKIDVSNLIV